MRILIVDDDFTSRKILQKMLAQYGSVDVATDGEEGVAAFHSALKEGEAYDLITMDIIMPNMDGQKCLQEIRQIEKERGVDPKDAVKVIMVSGLSNNEALHDAFFLGAATSYITKPISKEVLLNEMSSLGLVLS
ncbi:response regulator [Desulfovibrio litoralis]|uniref:Two-component system, chemotaxis family, response regulator CheY n=1 Tax=Desulfovibrio litoralis DSM 11393 TaxID=1121455 RepID=A0A1M7RWV9_9BACT|nr:response regulator [Desulfovibrio litoralis]SHN50847.1 two-component system, chemotaxis family, response regulator CheY [Desulfovibrio litoralis DSM 11393]